MIAADRVDDLQPILSSRGPYDLMRYLKPDPVDDDLIEQIITAATWAPSPGNSQGRGFIVAARALGLGTVFTTFHSTAEPTIRDTLDIPDDVHIGCLVPLGWPDRPFGPVARVGYGQVVHIDGWQGDLRDFPG